MNADTLLLASLSLPALALALDWAVFVSIDNYAHIASPSRAERTYRERSKLNPLGFYRTAGVLATGAIAGAGFLLHSLAIVILSTVACVACHLCLYATKSTA